MFPRGKTTTAVLFLSLFFALPPADAAEYSVGEAEVRVSGRMTYGMATRTEERDPALIPRANGAAIGIAGRAAGGRNSDDGDLNYGKGDTVSRVLKGYLDLDTSYRQLGAFIRLKAWRDFALAEDAVPWGNTANGHAANEPLSDRHFPLRARFSGAVVEDAYLKGRFQLGELPVDARLGRQTFKWGESSTIGGGLGGITPVDQAAARRPGAVAEETRIAVPALAAKVRFGENSAAEVFQQFGFEPTVLNPCGTFYSTADYTSPGCDRMFIGSGSDRSSAYIHSAPIRSPHDDLGQFGAAFTFKVEPLATEFGLFAAQYHSRTPFVGFIKNANPGDTPVLASDLDNPANARYFLEYPERLRMVSLTFATKLPQTVVSGELTYRPNLPIQLNNGDLRNAFTSNTEATPLRAAAAATAPGQAFHGFDRFQATHLQLGATRTFEKFLGAGSATLGAEAAVKYVAGLPDPGQRRYGRKDAFGSGPVDGVCTGGSLQCTYAGYVSPWSWGYRLRAQLTYTDLIDGVTLKPALTFGQDVKGWSADDVFIAGRRLWTASLRADFGRGFYGRIDWQRSAGQGYDIARDRDAVFVVIGASL